VLKKITLGISGSIAAYKSIELARSLKNDGFGINIVLSKFAHTFVSVLTLKSLFPGSVYGCAASLGDNDEMLHISLANSVDCILIAPASANIIAKLASGTASCLLSSLCLAAQVPIILAPAMNASMWNNRFVQRNIDILKQNNIQIIGPVIGIQACGATGIGRMLDIDQIIEHINL